MRLLVIDHPLVAHKVTALRDARTDSPTFRRLVDELVTLLAYEATRDVASSRRSSSRLWRRRPGVRLARPLPLVVPVLRAGLGMLDGMVRLLPTAEVGFLGMVRDESTLQPSMYAIADARRPDRPRGASSSTRCSRPAAPSPRPCGYARPRRLTGHLHHPALRPRGHRGHAEALGDESTPVTVVTAALDERLNEKGYIVPGLGDAGDRLYGSAG